MKRGFTLIEVIGVVVIIAALALITMPIVEKSIKDGINKLYDNQIDAIKLSLEAWTREFQKPKNNEVITLTLSQLKEAGLVDMNIKNPKTKELFPNDMILKINNIDGIITYEVLDDTGSNNVDYTLIPSLSLNGDILIYVEIDASGIDNYTDDGVVAKDQNNNILEVSISTNPEIDVTKKGTYLRSYSATANNYSNMIYRTIIVRDTKGPDITFNSSLTIPLSQLASYDFLNDVVVSDNSGENVDIEVLKNFTALAGTYSIKYVATDTSGNQTTKLRTVNVVN